MIKKDQRTLIDLIKYPIITDKATRLLELNQYSFAIDPKANKTDIKSAIEYLFDVKVTSVNTYNTPKKTRRIGRFVGSKTRYKRAIVTLASGDAINLFSEN
nr:ribosomal protein L23 [Hemiselmis andersenii]